MSHNLIPTGILEKCDIVLFFQNPDFFGKVKPLGKQLKKVDCFAGATIMGDGGVALIVDVARIGRKAGTVPDYVYSEAMKQSGITWTPEKMTAYVDAPKTVVPGGKMKFDGKLTPQESADLMAFLATVH